MRTNAEEISSWVAQSKDAKDKHGQQTFVSNGQVSSTPPKAPESTLWTLTMSQKVLRFVLIYLREIAKFWYDEHGDGPVHRFLRHDEEPLQHQSILPAKRVLIFMVLGVLLSAMGVWFTDDEYIQGPGDITSVTELPVHIAFKDLGCIIPDMDHPALQNVTGEIMPGKLTAILGQSGSGKTTFTQALLGRNHRHCSKSLGALFLNGRQRNLESYIDRVGFVPQDDVLYPELTVEETLMFSASWRIPRAISEEQKRKLLEETLETLDLTRIRHQRIGDVQHRGISGGEKKRVSIGMELISNPSVLVMDEPTSGLDSAGAYRLVQTLRAIADKGVSVVTVLHQPSARVFDLVQDIILLQDGKSVYVGPREGVMEFLHDTGYSVPGMSDLGCTDGFASSEGDDAGYEASQASPAEFLLDVLARLEHPRQFKNATASSTFSDFDLSVLWKNTPTFERQWQDTQAHMAAMIQREDEQHGNLSPNSISEFSIFGRIEFCGTRYPHNRQSFMYCMLFASTTTETPYPKRPKPGLKKQVSLWFTLLSKLSWRRGVLLEACVIASLALVVAFVRSYNTHWNRRPLANFFVSIAIGLLGMLGAVFNDDIGPVRRAATSGMLLGAHEFAVIMHDVLKGRISSELFSLSFFSFLYLRTGVWCVEPFSMRKYWEWVHMIHLNYSCANIVGSIICVVVDHDAPTAYVAAVASLIAVHVFAFFTPSKNQIEKDSMIFGHVNTAPLVHFLCSISYVRYWMEAIILWEPHGDDRVGRNYSLRHFGYREGHKSMCCTLMTSIGLIGYSIRFVLFCMKNTNVFHSLYDTPLFAYFILKVSISFLCALLLMTILHEYPTIKAAWTSAAEESVLQMLDEDDEVDILALDEDDDPLDPPGEMDDPVISGSSRDPNELSVYRE